ncbi:putative sigma factor [Oceanicaulis sp. HTCC2633]|uniref:RNA polymerase sigma factor SigJ n=1 Tax=Oceanicaulis sp. HTCC2633 TaxID=314254 RepID=UPI000066D425|nr:RNA polymerase sigma factor SigJ [Oceanicaulis sp. HTCC2633]EAP91459.1 putative sigma factor [Oceanicaulis sp. HTCC2633]
MTQTAVFEAERPSLMALAYRMLGERAIAEDVVQEAWLRWRKVEPETLDQPAAWLRTITTRLAIDALRRARSRRESYIGPWLPEPVLEDPASDFTARLETVQQAELALVWVMEFLTPDERAAFVLHDTFEEPYAVIASVLEKSETACRKLVSRARAKTGAAPMQLGASRDAVMGLLERLMQASASGDLQAIRDLLAQDVVAISDGGGKARAALRPLYGADETAQVMHALATRKQIGARPVLVMVNGAPGMAILEGGALDHVTTLAPSRQEPSRIGWLYTMRNPDKLPVKRPG